jgi:two-component system response regulator AtoC
MACGEKAVPMDLPHEISVKVGTTLVELEKQLIRATLLRYRSRKKVAALLGISLKTLYNKVRKYQLGG